MPVYKNLGPFTIGEDILITDTVTSDGTSTGTPVDVTGWTGTLSLYDRRENPSPFASVSFTAQTTNGKLQAVILHATSILATDRMYWSEWTRLGAGVQTCVTAGGITFGA